MQERLVFNTTQSAPKQQESVPYDTRDCYLIVQRGRTEAQEGCLKSSSKTAVKLELEPGTSNSQLCAVCFLLDRYLQLALKLRLAVEKQQDLVLCKEQAQCTY